jgi:outer membrane protein OmpA-like peptidoglycan-associated protein
MKQFIAVALVSLFLSAQAQDEGSTRHQEVRKYPKIKTAKKKKIAEQLVKDGSYINAVAYYEDVLKDKGDNIKVIHILGELNRKLRDYKQAEKYYKLSVSKDPKKFPNDKYYLGQMLMMNGKYDEAKKTLQEYLKADIDKDEKSYKALAKVAIEGCDSSTAWLANPNKVRVDHEDAINGINTEGCPRAIGDNTVMYFSLKPDSAVGVGGKTDISDHYAKIYTIKRDGKGWKDNVMLPFPPNDAKNHVSNAILTDDGKTMFFAKCGEALQDNGKCKIFKCDKQGAEWSNATEVKELNSATYTTTQPTLGLDKDGKPAIYFVSDRGGKGGLDIFYAPIQDDGKFGPVKNAGSEVNTPGDDMTPFYDKKAKTLYYSTDGRPGLGGLDVYKVSGAPDAWGIPANMGAPVNSSADDIYYALDLNGKKGYMVSNRVGTKTMRGETSSDDIWSFAVREDVVLAATFALRTDPTRKPVEGVDASMYFVDGANFTFMSNTLTTKDPVYTVLKRGGKYKINGNKEGLWPAVENVNVKEDEEADTIYRVVLIDPIIRTSVKIENIYFAFDESSVVDFYKEKMDSIVSVMMQNPGYSLEVKGHTDSKGSDEYNIKLSQRRADEAKAYIISKGVNKDRVVTKAMGKTVPLVPNEKDGQDDPEGRAQNRRVEFQIIPDKPENAPTIEYEAGKPVDDTKTGPGFEGKPRPKKSTAKKPAAPAAKK